MALSALNVKTANNSTLARGEDVQHYSVAECTLRLTLFVHCAHCLTHERSAAIHRLPQHFCPILGVKVSRHSLEALSVKVKELRHYSLYNSQSTSCTPSRINILGGNATYNSPRYLILSPPRSSGGILRRKLRAVGYQFSPRVRALLLFCCITCARTEAISFHSCCCSPVAACEVSAR